jgi:hypothetical protein
MRLLAMIGASPVPQKQIPPPLGGFNVERSLSAMVLLIMTAGQAQSIPAPWDAAVFSTMKLLAMRGLPEEQKIPAP